MDLGVGPLLRSDRQTRRRCLSRSRQHACRPGLQHLEGSLRVIGVFGRLSAPCSAGEGNHGDRLVVGWTRRDGHRRRLGESGIRRLWDRLPRCKGSPRSTRGRHPVPARVVARRRHRLRRGLLHPHHRAQRRRSDRKGGRRPSPSLRRPTGRPRPQGSWPPGQAVPAGGVRRLVTRKANASWICDLSRNPCAPSWWRKSRMLSL